MDDSNKTAETTDNKLGIKHELGQLFVGGMAAYAADQLGQRAYVKVLHIIRARRSK